MTCLTPAMGTCCGRPRAARSASLLAAAADGGGGRFNGRPCMVTIPNKASAHPKPTYPQRSGPLNVVRTSGFSCRSTQLRATPRVGTATSRVRCEAPRADAAHSRRAVAAMVLRSTSLVTRRNSVSLAVASPRCRVPFVVSLARLPYVSFAFYPVFKHRSSRRSLPSSSSTLPHPQRPRPPVRLPRPSSSSTHLPATPQTLGHFDDVIGS